MLGTACLVGSAGLRTGQTGQLPRGLHKKGPPQKHIFFDMDVSYSVCHRGLLVNVCKFHFNHAFYTEVNDNSADLQMRHQKLFTLARHFSVGH